MKKVWTYAMSKELNNSELDSLQKLGESFVTAWTAHENKLDAGFRIEKKRLVIIEVNEAVAQASGCSIDKLQRFMKEMESKFAIELLNRLLVAYKNDSAVEVVHSSKIGDLLQSGALNENTIVFDTSVSTGTELANWKKPLKDTWLKKFLDKVRT